MSNLSELIQLLGAIGSGFVAAMTTGFTVAYTFTRKLPTYQLMLASFVVAAITWGITSLLMGSFLAGFFYVLLDWIGNPIAIFALGCLTGILFAIVGTLLIQLRDRGVRLWAVLGAGIPWGVISLLSSGAYFWFMNTDTWDRQLPEFFFSIIYFAMAIGIILGSCVGSTIYHQTRHWRE